MIRIPGDGERGYARIWDPTVNWVLSFSPMTLEDQDKTVEELSRDQQRLFARIEQGWGTSLLGVSLGFYRESLEQQKTQFDLRLSYQKAQGALPRIVQRRRRRRSPPANRC